MCETCCSGSEAKAAPSLTICVALRGVTLLRFDEERTTGVLHSWQEKLR